MDKERNYIILRYRSTLELRTEVALVIFLSKHLDDTGIVDCPLSGFHPRHRRDQPGEDTEKQNYLLYSYTTPCPRIRRLGHGTAHFQNMTYHALPYTVDGDHNL